MEYRKNHKNCKYCQYYKPICDGIRDGFCLAKEEWLVWYGSEAWCCDLYEVKPVEL